MVDAGAFTDRDVLILIQAQKWWEVRHKQVSPEWVIMRSPLPDDVAGRGKVAGLSELNYSEVSLYNPVIGRNGVPLPWTNRLILKILLHENAHRYYQDKGRFSRDKVSTSKEERVVDEMAENDLEALERENPTLSVWLGKIVPRIEIPR